MPEEKSTQEQITENALYHNRNLTLFQMALSNVVMRNFGLSGQTTSDFNGIAAGKVTFPESGDIPEEIETDYLCMIGFDSTIPAAPIVYLSSNAGENFEKVGVAAGYTGHLNAVAIEDGVVLIAGDDEEIQKLNSEEEFEQKNTGGSERINCLAKGGGVWLAGGDNGVLLKSTNNGNSWANKTPLSDGIRSIAYGNNKFVAVLEDGKVAYSTDLGESWTELTVPLFPGADEQGLVDIIFDGEQFLSPVEIEKSGTILPGIAKSTNGTSWAVELLPAMGECEGRSIIYADGVHLIAGAYELYESGGGFVWVSYDGAETWAIKPIPVKFECYHCMAYISTAFHFIGRDFPSQDQNEIWTYFHTLKLY